MKGISVNEEKRLLKKVTLYSIASFGTKIASFLIVPYYTYVLSTRDYGYYDVLNNTTLLIVPLLTLQTSEAIIAGCKDDRFDNSQIVKSTISILTVNVLFFFICFGLFNYFASIKYGWFFAGSVVMTSLMITLQQYARGYSNSKGYAISGIIYTAFFLSSNIICLSLLKIGVVGLFISSIIASFFSVIFIIILIPDTLKAIRLEIDKECLSWIVKYSLPLIPNALCWWLIGSSDRFVIRLFLGNSANGIYALSYRFSTVLSTITGLVYLAWQEISLESYKKSKNTYLQSRIFNKYAKILLCISLVGIYVTRPFSEIVIQADYMEAWKYVPFLYVGVICIGLASFLNTAYLAEGKTKAILNGTLIAGIINIVMDLTLIRYIGIYAAAISTFASGIVLLFIRIRYNQKYIELKVDWVSIIILALLNLAITYIVYFYAYSIFYWIFGLIILITICVVGKNSYNRNI